MSRGEIAAVARAAGSAYWRAAEARVVVEAWRRSGEGLGAFARRHGIEPRRLGRWVRRLPPEQETVQFHAVRLLELPRPDRGPGAAIEIVLAGGRSVRVPPGFAAEDLERVLAVLAVEAAC